MSNDPGYGKQDIDCIILGGLIQMSQASFLFCLVHNHKKAPYSVIVSHKVKFRAGLFKAGLR